MHIEKIIALAALAVVAVTFIWLFVGRGNAESAKKENSVPIAAVTEEASGSAPLADTVNGVQVTVKNVKRENGKTVVALAMDNHRFDLTALDPLPLSRLDGKAAESYALDGEFTGGHHIESTMTFSGELRGTLMLALNDELVFTFTLE